MAAGAARWGVFFALVRASVGASDRAVLFPPFDRRSKGPRSRSPATAAPPTPPFIRADRIAAIQALGENTGEIRTVNHHVAQRPKATIDLDQALEVEPHHLPSTLASMASCGLEAARRAADTPRGAEVCGVTRACIEHWQRLADDDPAELSRAALLLAQLPDCLPTSAVAHCEVAVAHAQEDLRRRDDSAIPVRSTTIAYARGMLAQALLRAGQVDEAEQVYRETIMQYPPCDYQADGQYVDAFLCATGAELARTQGDQAEYIFPLGVSHALTKSFLNPGNMRGCMPRSPGKQVASGLLTNDSGHQSGQLIIGELLQEVQCFLPCRQVIRCHHLHTVVVVLVHVGLIDSGDGHP